MTAELRASKLAKPSAAMVSMVAKYSRYAASAAARASSSEAKIGSGDEDGTEVGTELGAGAPIHPVRVRVRAPADARTAIARRVELWRGRELGMTMSLNEG